MRKGTNISLVLVFITIGLLVSVNAAAAAIVTGESIKSETDLIKIDLSIPVLANTGDWLYTDVLNTQLRLQHLKQALTISQMAKEDKLALEEMNSARPFFQYSAFSRHEVKYNKDGILSLVQTFYTYTGGAHGMTLLDAVNLDLVNQKELTLADILPELERQKAVILAEINRQIAIDPSQYFMDYLPVDYLNEDNFYLTEEGLVIFYQLYEIAPYASGIQEFVIPWNLLESE